jgi:hypothetical protein
MKLELLSNNQIEEILRKTYEFQDEKVEADYYEEKLERLQSTVNEYNNACNIVEKELKTIYVEHNVENLNDVEREVKLLVDKAIFDKVTKLEKKLSENKEKLNNYEKQFQYSKSFPFQSSKEFNFIFGDETEAICSCIVTSMFQYSDGRAIYIERYVNINRYIGLPVVYNYGSNSYGASNGCWIILSREGKAWDENITKPFTTEERKDKVLELVSNN